MDAVKEMALAPTDVATVDPMLSMMERLASNKDVDVVKLQALIDMQKDIMAVNAKAAFNAAKSKMLAALPTIIETAKGDKDKDIWYAPLEEIIEKVKPILAQHGFALSHRTEWPDKATVKVIGILTHEQGHSEESVFQASADQTGSKNAIQALGSSVSYGRRYTTNDLLCIVTRKQDDDGKKSEATKEPDGFTEWVDGMDAFVLDGCTRKQLDEKWYAAPEAFRAYMSKTDRQHIEGWKKAVKK